MATNSFSYNGLDTRAGKVDSSGTSTYKRDGADVTDPVLFDRTIAYTPGFSERKSGTTTFDHADFLGTFTRQTNSSQTTTATRVYDAFGNLESTTGTPQSPFGFAGQHGYQEDGDSGVKLLGHRYYDPSIGRFLTRDQTKDGRNWIGYCENIPVSLVDWSGYMPVTVTGGTSDQRKHVRDTISKIIKTRRGKELNKKFVSSGGTPTVIIVSPGGLDSSGGGETERTGNDAVISIDLTYHGTVTGPGNKQIPDPPERIIAHEFGHAAGRDADDGYGNLNNVNKNENPIVKEWG